MTAPPEPAQGGVASISSCVYNLTNTIIGSGVLALPAAFATCGSALGSGLLLVFALFSAHGLHLLSLSAQIVADGNGTASFRAVASSAAPRFATFVDLAVVIKCFGVACSLSHRRRRQPADRRAKGAAGRGVRGAARAVDPLRGARRDAAGAEAKTRQPAPRERGVARLLRRHRAPRRERDVRVGPRRGHGAGVVADFRTLKNLPIFVFGFTCHQNIFAVNNELRDPTRRRLDLVVVGAVSLALAFYLVIANAGYATRRSARASTRTCLPVWKSRHRRDGWSFHTQVLTNYAAAPAIALARVAVALEVTSAIPLQLHPSRECIKSLLQRDAPAADYSLIDGESPSHAGGGRRPRATTTRPRRRATSSTSRLRWGFWQERWPSRCRSGRWARCCRSSARPARRRSPTSCPAGSTGASGRRGPSGTSPPGSSSSAA